MKTKLTFLILILTISISNIFSNDLVDSVVHKEQVYKTIDTIELKVDIFYQESSLLNDNNSAIAFFHGGGWVCGERSDFYETCKRYASKGMIAFTFQYRFADQKTITPIACVSDAKSAIRWIRENADKYKINIDKIVASGQSAGGHLAISTLMIEDYDEINEDIQISSKPNAIIVWSVPTVLAEDDWMSEILLDRKDEISNIDPIKNIKPDLPPILAFHGTDDEIVPYWTIEKFIYEMKKQDNIVELVRIENKGHFFDEDCMKHARMFNDSVFPRVDEFLVKNNFIK